MSLKPDLIEILRDPFTQGPLQLLSTPQGEEALVNIASGRKFPIRNGIPIFIKDTDVSGENQKYQKLYDWTAPIYDISDELYAWFKSGGIQNRRLEYLNQLDIQPNARFLEVSVGTGLNWQFLPRALHYFGIDLSWGMLKRCKRKVKRRGLDANLFQSLAEQLPFADACFDAVLHRGGINYFTDKA